jgi:hypothetical protein
MLGLNEENVAAKTLLKATVHVKVPSRTNPGRLLSITVKFCKIDE